ncbi:MAG: hypothetical protein K6F21_06405 [Bacteroidales bacterium]|nr:hypothetical protein [Bacteroidales bacterium]
MKAKYFIFALALAAVFGCDKAEKDVEEPIVAVSSDFVGTVTVDSTSGETFDNENIEVNFIPAEDGKTCSLIIQDIQFSPKMPLIVTVTIPSITLSSTSKKISMECKKVVPLAMGGEFEAYTVTDFSGEIVGDNMTFSLNFGQTPTRFSGTIIKKAE